MSEEEIQHLDDNEIMLECIRLILQKKNIDRVEDIMAESLKLFNFVKNKGSDV